MKIKVYSRGETVIDADDQYQEPMIREAIDQRGDVASVITDYTDKERSDISHDHYAVVTGDGGRLLWKGWLTGDPAAPVPPGVPCPGGCGCFLGTDDADRRECGCDGGCCDE